MFLHFVSHKLYPYENKNLLFNADAVVLRQCIG